MNNTEEYYREIVLKSALLKKDARAVIKRLQQMAQNMETDVRLLRIELDTAYTLLSDD